MFEGFAAGFLRLSFSSDRRCHSVAASITLFRKRFLAPGKRRRASTCLAMVNHACDCWDSMPPPWKVTALEGKTARQPAKVFRLSGATLAGLVYST